MVRIDVRAASEEDIPAVIGMCCELGRPKPRQDSDMDGFRGLARRYIGDPDKRILIARVDGTETAGMASAVLLPRLNRKTPELYIPELVVLEKYQNRGVGRRLVEHCVLFGRQNRCHRIRLESGNGRKGSHRFYLHTGFEQSSMSFTRSL